LLHALCYLCMHCAWTDSTKKAGCGPVGASCTPAYLSVESISRKLPLVQALVRKHHETMSVTLPILVIPKVSCTRAEDIQSKATLEVGAVTTIVCVVVGI
jgi:hypothetical protein